MVSAAVAAQAWACNLIRRRYIPITEPPRAGERTHAGADGMEGADADGAGGRIPRANSDGVGGLIPRVSSVEANNLYLSSFSKATLSFSEKSLATSSSYFTRRIDVRWGVELMSSPSPVYVIVSTWRRSRTLSAVAPLVQHVGFQKV